MSLARSPEAGRRFLTLAGTDRKWALGLALLAALYAAAAIRYRPDFIADPLGPRAFPWLVAIVLGAAAAALWLRAGATVADWPDRPGRLRVSAAVIAFVVYAVLLEPLGFLLATAGLATGLGRLFGAPPLRSLAGGVGIAAVLYALFAGGLGLALPAGPFAGFIG